MATLGLGSTDLNKRRIEMSDQIDETVRLPQYLKSEDPEVVALVRRNSDGLRDWQERAHAFAAQYGDDPVNSGFYYSSFSGSFQVSAIHSIEEPPHGGWRRTKGDRWEPRAKNPLREEMAAIRFRYEDVPGLPRILTVTAPDGGIIWRSPVTFAHEDTAWADLGSGDVRVKESGYISAQWQEVYASEYWAAREAYEEVSPS